MNYKYKMTNTRLKIKQKILKPKCFLHFRLHLWDYRIFCLHNRNTVTNTNVPSNTV